MTTEHSTGLARKTIAAVLLALPLAAGTLACSDSSASDTSSGDRADATGSPSEPPQEDAGGRDAATGSGSATLTVGDETWNFDQVMCAFGEDEIGIEGAEFNMAARSGSLSLYAAIDPGHTYIELADLDAMDDGGLNWTTAGADGADPSIELSGREVSASATFMTMAEDGASSHADGSLRATCP